ncbi:hypothetical protein [Paenibacillus agricola]|uniref:Uncharacterized protein n=1 Tax=Paenibacillus agricola TaxID=2716264 RepID=A0ABX0JAP6_9BACL|nr:hypothetical protein [Paenibacillus agricola]NHN33530.1 hypothetical protein [Paenibacillus agricola]
MKIETLNLEILGATLLRIAPVALKANHKWPKSTLKDYVLPEEGSEADFVRDLFTMETQAIVDKWYGGDDNAAGFLFSK